MQLWQELTKYLLVNFTISNEVCIFIAPHAVMANGGTICNSGSLLLAVAAKAHSVPFIVLAGLFKLTP